MTTPNHYDTLDVDPAASQADIKQAYRRLAKQFHPDSNQATASHDRITQINAAYEVLGDPQRRRSYDAALHQRSQFSHAGPSTQRQRRAAQAQQHYYERRQTGQDADAQFEQWIQRVYQPIHRKVQQILQPLQEQIDELAADPFDDTLMEEFQIYLEDCQTYLEQAQRLFRSMPNPPTVAGVAAHLYHCLNQIGDGIEELNLFTLNYDDHHLHTGQELFRIARGLQREAQSAMKTARS